jgi:hypothetical protein
MRAHRIPILLALAVGLAGCGGGGGSSSSTGGGGAGKASSTVVAKVDHAKGAIENGRIVATAHVKVGGGKPGAKYTLEWGIIDAVAGVRASDSELVAGRYTTTGNVEQHDVKVSAKIPGGTTAYLVHFVLNGPDGSYVSSSDSDVFQADGS